MAETTVIDEVLHTAATQQAALQVSTFTPAEIVFFTDAALGHAVFVLDGDTWCMARLRVANADISPLGSTASRLQHSVAICAHRKSSRASRWERTCFLYLFVRHLCCPVCSPCLRRPQGRRFFSMIYTLLICILLICTLITQKVKSVRIKRIQIKIISVSIL